MFYLNMVDYPMFFLLFFTGNDLGHLPDLTLRGTKGWLVSEPCTPTQVGWKEFGGVAHKILLTT